MNLIEHKPNAPAMLRRKALAAILLISESIREAGTIPSGHLYAAVMNHMDMAAYQGIIHTLKNAGLVQERGHNLHWIGPEIRG